MPFTLTIWLVLFVALAVLAFFRPAWGVALYMLAFFAFPSLWWWGGQVADYRWSLYSGGILLLAVLGSGGIRLAGLDTQVNIRLRQGIWIGLAMLANATFVHYALAEQIEISSESYSLLAKFTLLFLLIFAATKTQADFRLVQMAILLGAAYIGYEATINDRGSFSGNRLEDIGAPGATGANHCASLFVTVLPIAGALFITGSRWQKLVTVVAAPLILNVVILCNSRGAFLGIIAAGIVFLIAAPRPGKRQALKAIGLAVVAGWLLLTDPRIVERFMTTFASAEERDVSAASRLTFWTAGVMQVSDHPLGAGGDSFKHLYSKKYLSRLGYEVESRAVHNGYINEACEWGIQGLALRLALFTWAVVCLYRMAIACRTAQSTAMGINAAALLASLTAFAVTSMFGDLLDSEWGYWMIGLAAANLRFLTDAADAEDEVLDEGVLVDGELTDHDLLGSPSPLGV